MKRRISTLLLALLLLLPLISAPASAALVSSGDYWTELSQLDRFHLELDIEDGTSGPFYLVFYSQYCGFSKKWVPQFREYAEYNKIPMYGLDKISANELKADGLSCVGTFPFVVYYDGAGNFTVADEVHSLEKFQSLVGGTLDESQGDYVIQMGKLIQYTGTDRDLVIPEGVTEIASWAIPKDVRSVVLPESLKRIDAYAFPSAICLPTLTIPAGVMEIETNAFGYNGLRTIRFLGSKPNMPTGEDSPFADTDAAAIYPTDDPTWGSVEELRTQHPTLNWGALPGQIYNKPYYEAWNDGTISPWAVDEVWLAHCSDIFVFDGRKNYNSPVSRELFCELAMKTLRVCTGQMSHLIVSDDDANPFTDTESVEIRAAYALRLVTGRGNGRFDPKGTITRQEAAAILARLARYMEVEEGSSLTFSDQASIAPWALDSVSYLSGLSSPVNGRAVMGGANGAFMPNSVYTLQEAYCSFLRLAHIIVAA